MKHADNLVNAKPVHNPTSLAVDPAFIRILHGPMELLRQCKSVCVSISSTIMVVQSVKMKAYAF